MRFLSVIALLSLILLMATCTEAKSKHKSTVHKTSLYQWNRPWQRPVSASQASALLREVAGAGDIVPAKYCLSHGANINYSDKDGYTPLMTAALENQSAMVKFLIAEGASVNMKTSAGSAIEVVQTHQMMRLLKSLGATGSPIRDLDMVIKPTHLDPWEKDDASIVVFKGDLTVGDENTGISSVTGQAVNNSGHAYSYVEIDINFYDANNVQVDSSLSNTRDLANQGRWNFKVTTLANNVDHYKIIRVFGTN